MRDQIDFKETGPVVVPVGGSTNRDLVLEERTRFGRRPTMRQGGAAGGREQAIRCRRTEGEEQGTGWRIERQFAMSFEGVEQIRHAWHEPFTADPVGDLPKLDERTLDGRRVGRRAWSCDRTGTSTRRMVQEGQRVSAVIAGGGNELVENPLFLRTRRRDVAR